MPSSEKKPYSSSFWWSYMYVFSFNGYPTMGIGDDTVKKLTAD